MASVDTSQLLIFTCLSLKVTGTVLDLLGYWVVQLFHHTYTGRFPPWPSESGKRRISVSLIHLELSTGPAAEPSGRSSLPLSAGGMGTPPCIGKREVGTYIYSRTYTAYGTLGDFIEVLQLLM